MAMGLASQRLIAAWSPDAFAVNLQRAVAASQSAPLPRAITLDHWLLSALQTRRT